MQYMSAQEAAEKWGITKRRVQVLCSENRIYDATRIGNMWILPHNAQKPSDGRHKKICVQPQKQHNPIRLARNKIKNISIQGMQKLSDMGYSSVDSKMTIINVFASELLMYHVDSMRETVTVQQAENALSTIITYKIKKNTDVDTIRSDIRSFIKQYQFCCDDALSWSYQYINKMSIDTQYSNTQFFTEKYMITSIVDSIDLSSKDKILDPACGGGNFLLYCIDVLSDMRKIQCGDKKVIIHFLNEIVSKLYGYEIDSTLALIASINLRLKCIEVLKKKRCNVFIDDFTSISPNIFYPIESTIAGALEVKNGVQKVSKVGSNDIVLIGEIFNDTDVIITNPPFQTIKGMPQNLKQYLKMHYTDAKCDMCNAFIELSQSMLTEGGVAGLVTQNSWMYLDSFFDLRCSLLSKCTIQKVWELGSNAFYDLNGEKSNVALLLYSKVIPDKATTVDLTSLKLLDTAEIEKTLSFQLDDSSYTQCIFQQDILNNVGSRFDMISSDRFRELLLSSEKYQGFAVPMQGTSTGNAKELIDFFWNHIDDEEWVAVSKGGGYSRWQGLNHYCVKWGKDGEHIKATKGSAIRNASYFKQTQMVFSDTGTAGLNVRTLLDGQIFVASGPGIRINIGDTYAHLAFLNSRFASYYIRLLSPKLTIAAGYIAQIPTCSEILTSKYLSEYAVKCIEVKKHRLAKRVCNIEFRPHDYPIHLTIAELAYKWFIEDLQDEWEQLQYESLMDDFINSVMGIEDNDIAVMDNFIGTKKIWQKNKDESINSELLSNILQKSLDANCNIIRTKADKKSLGCDGILEFLSQKADTSVETIYKHIINHKLYPQFVKEKYENFCLHTLTMSALGYKNITDTVTISQIVKKMKINDSIAIENFKKWFATEFNHVHTESFLKSPIYKYDAINELIISAKENNK